MDFLQLTHDSLNVDDISSKVKDPKCGAVSLFIGTTRDNFEGKVVKQLEYEAYQTMALQELKKICNNARSKWSLQHIAIYHR